MLTVKNINPIGKGNLLATCDVHIKPWQMTLCEVKIFEKGATRWVGMPSKEFTNEVGEKKYRELMEFDSEAIKSRFRAQILEAVDKYLAENPDLKPEDAIKESVAFPF